MPKTSILRVAVPSPLRRHFDYLPPENPTTPPQPGVRVRVPFGRRTVVGLVLELAEESDVATPRLKRVLEIVDREPLLPPDLLALLKWGSRYYHHPIGKVVMNALPTRLRDGSPIREPSRNLWQLSEAGREATAHPLNQAPRQQQLINLLSQAPEGVAEQEIRLHLPNWRSIMSRLKEKGWVVCREPPPISSRRTAAAISDADRPRLNPDQQNAVEQVIDAAGKFSVALLEGVTGSGKTEVYLRIIEQNIAAGRQALVLVPEINLTPQLLERFTRRFPQPIALLHSALTARERLAAWQRARSGEAAIVIGTRSALFTPFRRLGIIIVDEEHDTSFKQQEGFRYSARDMAIIRARDAAIPIVLGSATPSLESLHNAQQQRYLHLTLSQRAGDARPPRFQLLDMRHQSLQEGLSAGLLEIIGEHLQAGGQILLFLNRRGYAPTLLCHECGWSRRCNRCDTHLTLHQYERRLRCHHCGAERPVDLHCPECGSVDLRTLGAGTERIEKALQQHFPDTGIARLDRDSTRRKGSLQRLLKEIHSGHTQILIGTQMLAKGHHFPNVTLVGILDTDQGLFSADFRASERMSQLIVQVAGRAGRAEKPGLVVIQTHHPEHPLLQQLVTRGYRQFAQTILEERREAELPPYSSIALLRAESVDARRPMAFLEQAEHAFRELAPDEVVAWGPVPAPMERRAGRYRAHLLLHSGSRPALQQLLDRWIPRLETLRERRRVRWYLDVDPVDLF